MNRKIITMQLPRAILLLVTLGYVGSVLGYTVKIHNRDWRTHTLKIDITAGADKHPVIKPGETVEVGVGGMCTRAVEIESPDSRVGKPGSRVDNPGGNCDSWTVWITRDGSKPLDPR